MEKMLEQWEQELRDADDEALRSQVAFTTGRFDQYMAERSAESQARLDAIYGNNNETSGSEPNRGDREPRSISGGGASRGG